MPKYDLRYTSCKGEHSIRASIAEKSEEKIPCHDCGSFELETVFKTSPTYVKGSSATKCPCRNSCGGCPKAM